MRAYKRAVEKEKNLNSVDDYTTIDCDETQNDSPTEVRTDEIRRAQRRVISNHRIDNGKRRHQSRRSGQTDGSPTVQYQQSDAAEVSSHLGFLSEDGGECGTSNRFKSFLQKGRAA